MANATKFKLERFELRKLFDKRFSKTISELGFFPVSAIFLKELKGASGKLTGVSIISIGHSNSQDLLKKVGHIEGEDSKAVRKLISFIEKKR